MERKNIQASCSNLVTKLKSQNVKQNFQCLVALVKLSDHLFILHTTVRHTNGNWDIV